MKGLTFAFLFFLLIFSTRALTQEDENRPRGLLNAFFLPWPLMRMEPVITHLVTWSRMYVTWVPPL